MMMMMSTTSTTTLKLLTRFPGKDEERGRVTPTTRSSSAALSTMKRSAIILRRRIKGVVFTSPRAFAREYPTYDELGAQPYETNNNNINIGGWQDRDNGNYYQQQQPRGEEFFFADEATVVAQQKSSQQQQQRRKNSAGSSSVSMVSSSMSPLASAAREWFEACFGLLKVTVPLTAMCACIAAASMHSARYTMLSQVYQLATGMTTAGVIMSGFAVVASVISGFFVAASAFADLGGTSGGSSAAARRKKNKNKKSANGFQQQQQQQQQQQGYNSSNDNFSSSYEPQSYQQQPVQQHYQQPQQQQQQQQQQRQRRKPVERYEPPVIHPTRPPSSPSKRAAREAYDSWTPEVPIVDPRAQVPRPSDVDYYSSSASAPSSQAFSQQPEWDRNESWGSYKSPGQRRREMGYEFKGTEALKNYVDPRDQYERRVSNSSPEAESVYNQYASRSNGDHLRAPRHDINNYTNPIPERDRLIPKPMERPKPGYIPTEVLIAMGGASLSTHIKTKFEDGSIREMRKQKEEFNKRKNAATANSKNNEPSSNATNMFGERVNPDDMFRRAR